MFRKPSNIIWFGLFVVLIGAFVFGSHYYTRHQQYDSVRQMLRYNNPALYPIDFDVMDGDATSYEERYLMGQYWVLAEKYSKALRQFRAAAALEGPEAAEAKVALGRTLLLAGDTTAAARLADSLRKAFGPTHSPSIYLQAHVHLARRECLKAANLFYAAFNTDSSQKRALYYRALAYVDTNDAPHAYHNIQHYMRLEKRNPEAYLVRAIVNQMRGENGRVIDNLETNKLISDSIVTMHRPWGSDVWDVKYLALLDQSRLNESFLAEAARQDSLGQPKKAGMVAMGAFSFDYLPPTDSGMARLNYFVGKGMLVENDSMAVQYLERANELDPRIPMAFDQYLQALAKFRSSEQACEVFRVRMEDRTLKWSRAIRVSTLRSLRECDNLPGWLKQQVNLSVVDDMSPESLVVL